MKKAILYAVIILFAVSVQAQQFSQQLSKQPENAALKFPAADTYAITKLTYKIIDAPNNTFCYNVYADNKLLIHQSSIPALPGNEGFKTKVDALKVAQLVCDKLKRGEMPPSVSIEEMKRLKIKFK